MPHFWKQRPSIAVLQYRKFVHFHHLLFRVYKCAFYYYFLCFFLKFSAAPLECNSLNCLKIYSFISIYYYQLLLVLRADPDILNNNRKTFADLYDRLEHFITFYFNCLKSQELYCLDEYFYKYDNF